MGLDPATEEGKKHEPKVIIGRRRIETHKINPVPLYVPGNAEPQLGKNRPCNGNRCDIAADPSDCTDTIIYGSGSIS